LLPTVRVPVLFLALVLASMVEPSNWPRAMRVERYSRAGVTPRWHWEFPAAFCVSHPSVRCKIAQSLVLPCI
jgi:hypothetical protein